MKKLSSPLSVFAIALLIISSYVAHWQNLNLSAFAKDGVGESNIKTEERETPEELETPESEETPEAKETPEPKETPDSDEFETEEEFEVKESTGEVKIKIRSGKNKFEFQQEGAKFSVESNFPLSVNPSTRELTVTTPSGSRVVAVLPQQAIDNMLAAKIVTSTSSVDLKTESDGSLSYDIDGTKNEKFLGIFDMAIPKNLIVSAQTGQILVVNQSTFSKILDLLSI